MIQCVQQAFKETSRRHQAFGVTPKTLEYRTGRKPLFSSIRMPELAWKKSKQTAFYNSLYSFCPVLLELSLMIKS